MRWLGKKNGELLTLAISNNFNLFISNDTQIKFQQNLTKLDISLIILKTKGNDLDLIQPLLTRLLTIIEDIDKGFSKEKYFEIY